MAPHISKPLQDLEGEDVSQSGQGLELRWYQPNLRRHPGAIRCQMAETGRWALNDLIQIAAPGVAALNSR